MARGAASVTRSGANVTPMLAGFGLTVEQGFADAPLAVLALAPFLPVDAAEVVHHQGRVEVVERAGVGRVLTGRRRTQVTRSQQRAVHYPAAILRFRTTNQFTSPTSTVAPRSSDLLKSIPNSNAPRMIGA